MGSNVKMEEKSIGIIPFKGEKGKWCTWPGTFMTRAEIRGYEIILKDTVNTLEGNLDEKKIKE